MAALLAVAAVLVMPAVYNGYPLVFSDTSAYVLAMASGGVPPDRPFGYAAFLRLTGGRVSLWPSIAVQGLLTALALWLVLRTYAAPPRSKVAAPGTLFTVVAVLALLTPLPWFTAQAMPDFLTPVAILCVFLLLVRWRESSVAARLTAGGLLVLACTAHYSNVLLIGALAGLWLLWGAVRRDGARLRAAGRAALGLGATCLLVLVMNYRQTHGRVFLTQGGHVFMVGRLLESHVMQRLLAEHCDGERYLLCPYRRQLPDSLELFMFDRHSPIQDFGGIREFPESGAAPMIRDAVRYYPGAVLTSSIANTGRQFVTFYTGDGLHPYPIGHPRFGDPPVVLHEVLPREYRAFANSREQRNALPVATLRLVHGVVVWAALLASGAILVLAVRARRRGRPPGAEPPAADLHAFVWLTALLNAGICASLTTVTDRLQARLVWLFAFACLVTLACWVFRRAPGRDPS